MSTASRAVFLSYASEDAPPAQRIADALRSAGVEVWFDREELRGGDAWDQKIRQQIRDCRLFVPIISANTEARLEGYFRREWKLAVDRTEDMAGKLTFLLPIVIDDTRNASAEVPERFRHVQWTRLRGGEPTPAFVALVSQLLTRSSPTSEPSRGVPTPSHGTTTAPVPAFPLKGHSPPRQFAVIVGACVIALAALGYFGYGRLSHRSSSLPTTAAPTIQAATEKSIAVLPFVDLSEKHDQEYFADGVAEELLNTLAKLPELKVIGRTSSFQFKGRIEDLRKVASILGAAYLVEGGVRRTSNSIRVTARLIEGKDGSHLWSATYDKSPDDILKVQDEITAAIARALQVEVSLAASPVKIRLRNAEAYDLYLRGLHATDRFEQTGFEEAIADFRQASELDPTFIPPAEALTRALVWMAVWDYMAPGVGFEQARTVAERVLTLDPRSVAAHANLAYIHTLYDWDWAAARSEADLALSLAPNSAAALFVAGHERLARAELNEALRFFIAAAAVDPLAANIHMSRAWVYERMNRPAEMQEAVRRVLQISPTFASAHYYLGAALLYQGKPREALAEFLAEPYESMKLVGVALASDALGRSAEADSALTAAQRATYTWAGGIAGVYSARGDPDRAIVWLNKAFDVRDTDMYRIKHAPLFRNIEGNSRYKALLRKLNLPE